MTQPSPSQSRASEVWRRLAGLFGAESVERKFGAKPPDEWIVMLSRLKDFEVDRGLRRLVYSGKAHVPSLPEFTRLCRMISDDGTDEGPRPLALPSPDAQTFDRWDIAGNERFLAYVRTRLSKEPRAWGAPKSKQQEQCTRIAVAYKNAWAADMREVSDPEARIPTVAEQNAAWNACMERAEVEIARTKVAP